MEDDASRALNGSTPGAPAVAKATRLLWALAAEPRGLGVSELARRTSLSKSTVHSLLAALHAEGLVTAAASRAYTLGPQLLTLGLHSQRQLLQRVAERRLSEADGGAATFLFGAVRGDEVVILDQRPGRNSLTISARVGSSVPLLAGALGKAYLSGLTPEQAAGYLRSRELPQYTDRTIVDRARYLEGVRAAREAGYATEQGEYLPGIAAAAACFSWLEESWLVWTVSIESVTDAATLQGMGEQVAQVAERMRTDLAHESSHGLTRSAS